MTLSLFTPYSIEMNELSHINKDGLPEMVDVSHKDESIRIATASGKIIAGKEIMGQLSASGFNSKKGSILQTAIIAGTMAVKNTYNTIPLCHQLPISSCKFDITPDDEAFNITCTVKTQGKTGVEMEALHGVSVAALTIYDMCKALSHEMTISNIHLEKKSGGKHDFRR
jgi:cyclic pyranopterin phosphate synthase